MGEQWVSHGPNWGGPASLLASFSDASGFDADGFGLGDLGAGDGFVGGKWFWLEWLRDYGFG